MEYKMDFNEIKKNQKIVKRQQMAYSIGRHTDSENTYPINSEKWVAFNLGRIARTSQGKRK